MMMVRNALEGEMARLEEMLRHEAGLARRMLADVLDALRDGDVAAADAVIAADDAVDDAWLQVERGIESLLARHTPVATDLRRVLGMVHVNVHLERMADYCVTIAKLAKLSHRLESSDELVEMFAAMGEHAGGMIEVAIDSFTGPDLELAESLVGLDQRINGANRRVAYHVLGLGEDEELREWGLRMLLVSRCIERIGDHAVDIGEQAAYLVTGEVREFTDASHPEDVPAPPSS